MPLSEPLNTDAARQLPKGTRIVIVDGSDGKTVVDRLTLMRYAGHYRTGSGDAFAIKDAGGKFRVRSGLALGLGGDSSYKAYLAEEFDASHTIVDLTASGESVATL